jgi:hypothetical protein
LVPGSVALPFQNRDTGSVSEYGIALMRGSAARQCSATVRPN